MRHFLYLVFCLYTVQVFSQKSQIIENKNLNHNYALGKVYYLEDSVDTQKLPHAGKILITTGTRNQVISSSLQRLEYRAKEINANSYKLESFTIKDTTINMVFDCYFIGEKQIKNNLKHRLKNKLFITNNIFDTITRSLVVNANLLKLKCNNYFSYSFSSDTVISIKTNTESEDVFSKELTYNEDAYFYTIGYKKNYTIGALPYLAWYLTNKYALHNFERFYKLDYNSGRLLLEIYNRYNKSI